MTDEITQEDVNRSFLKNHMNTNERLTSIEQRLTKIEKAINFIIEELKAHDDKLYPDGYISDGYYDHMIDTKETDS